MSPKADDLSILELFSNELSKQVHEMKDALKRLENSPSSHAIFEDLMRIAHSIKGAAKLINLSGIATLSGAMETVFRHASPDLLAKGGGLEELNEGVQFFESLSKVEPATILSHVAARQKEIELLIKKIQVIIGKRAKTDSNVLPSTNHAQTEDNEIPPKKELQLRDFFECVKEESTKIKSLLKSIDQDFVNDQVLQELIDIVRVLKSSVQNAGVQIIFQLAEALENCFIVALHGQLAWTQGHMDLILEAVDFLSRLGSIEAAEIENWIAKYERNIESIACVLKAISREAAAVSYEEKPPKSPEKEKVESYATFESIPQNPPVESPSNHDETMLNLFFDELEQRIRELNEGLLALEGNSTDSAVIESLMRTAHSLKGAARIVEFGAVSRLAHVMEDFFAAVERGNLEINSDSIDQIFDAVDLFTRLGQVPHQFINTWVSNNSDEIENTVKNIALLASEIPQNLSSRHPAERERSKNPPISHPKKRTIHRPEEVRNILPKRETEKGPKSSKDPFLRVTSSSLNKLMGLAGESLVESRWLAPFNESLLQLKRSQGNLSKNLDKLVEVLQIRNESYDVDNLLQMLKSGVLDCRSKLNERIVELELFMQRYSSLSDRLYGEVINSRMRPIADGIEGFPRLVRDLAKQLKKKAKLVVKGSNTPIDREILEKLESPLNHLVRNAIDHGIEFPEVRKKAGKNEEGTITIEASHKAGMLSIIFRDDGKGVDIEALRHRIINKGFVNSSVAEKLNQSELLDFIFLPGFSSSEEVTEISGRGIGLNVVQAMVQEVGGSIKASINQGLIFHMQLPLTLSVIRALLVEISGEFYALPLAHMEQVLTIPRNKIEHIEHRQYFREGDKNIGLVSAYQILELPPPVEPPEDLPVVVVADHMNYYGIVVDRFIGEKELVVQELEPMLGKVPDIYGAALMEDGMPLLIIDVEDIIRSIDKLLSKKTLDRLKPTEIKIKVKKKKKILVVDDSVTVREVQCRLLKNEGYDVETAINGADGWNALRLGSFDLVITDIDMPRMNGIDFVKTIKKDPKLKDLPVMIVSYKEREEDRIKGLEAGANYYLTKSSFHDETLTSAVKDLLGEK